MNTEKVKNLVVGVSSPANAEKVETAFEKWLARHDRFLVNRLVGILMVDDQVTEEELERLVNAFEKHVENNASGSMDLHSNSDDSSCD